MSPDFERLMQLRQTLVSAFDMPEYLLLPEVERLLSAAPHAHAHLIFNLLWQTGARINELLAVSFNDFTFHAATRNQDEYFEIQLRTLKQRTGNQGGPRRGRPREDEPTHRTVAVYCPHLRAELINYKNLLKRNKKRPLFVSSETDRPITAQTVRNWLQQASDNLAQRGEPLSIHVHPHVLRHSFAIHHVLHHTHIVTISKLLGHRSLKSTQVYLNLWKAELFAATAHVPFRSLNGVGERFAPGETLTHAPVMRLHG